jgi:serine/threonine protein kinase/tetratricopeptide (TPR) repeat protein
VIGTRLGPYEIVAPIGAGGMGEVYRARDTRLGRDVAIKVLPAELARDSERVKRFEKEARATGSLNHPNILAIHDVGLHEGSPYLVEELLEGQTLRGALRSGPLPARRAVEVAVQVAQGLAAAHGKGIVHRDLKPENLFITSEGHVKILDFGLAKLTEVAAAAGEEQEAETMVKSTELGAVLGTVGYMAPEQVRGMPCDHRADIFALGCVLYEMLSGRRAFKGPTPADTMSAVLTKDPPALAEPGSDIPAALQGIVSRCLEKRPEDRFSSAHDLALALQASSGTAGVTAPRRAVLPRSRRLLLGGVVVAVAAIAVALAVWRPWRTSSHEASSERPSLVAVPCKVYGAPEVAFLTDAVPQTISTLLGQVEGIDTKVPPTSFEAERVGGDLGRIAELYGVSSVVVTSLTETAGIFALNVQLVDVRTRSVRWSRQLEGSREAYNDLARQAAEGIRQAIQPGASPVPTAGVSSEAELALQEGVHLSTRYSLLHNQSDFDAAIVAFNRALELDPSLNVARAHIAWTYLVKYENEYGGSDALNEAEMWARRALEIDSRCGRAWGALSWVELYSTKPDIESQLEYALKGAWFSPTDPFIHMAVANSVQTPGALFLSLPPSRRVSEVDPFYVVGDLNVAMALSLLGRPEEALPFVDRVLRVEPDFELGTIIKGLVLLKVGRLEEARKTLARGEPQFLGNPGRFWSQMWGQVRFGLAMAERDTATIERLEQHIVAPLLDGRADSINLGNGSMLVSPALAHLGRADESFRILLRSVEMGIPPPYDWLLLEPDFQPLRGDPRFAKVLAASRDGAAMVARVLGEARTRGELPAYLEQPLDELVELLEKGTPDA